MKGDRSLLMTVAHELRKIYWRVVRPITVGVACIVVDEQDRVLLVRQSYGAQRWTFPGGTTRRGERLADAALRELAEETGVTVPAGPASLRLHGMFTHQESGKTDHVAVFVVPEWQAGHASPMEIAEQRFFVLEELPDGLSKAARRRLEEVFGRRPLDLDW